MKKLSRVKMTIAAIVFAVVVLGVSILLMFQLSYTSLMGNDVIKIGVEQTDMDNLAEIDGSLCIYKIRLQEANIKYKVVYNELISDPPIVSAFIKVRRIDFKKAREAATPFDQKSYDEWQASLKENE